VNNIAFANNPEAAKAFILDNAIPGRKFEVTDLTPQLEAAARVVALAWVAPNATHWANNFMADMKYRSGKAKGMSVGQAKGVLNVVRAEATPKAPKVEVVGQVALNAAKVRTARFRVVATDGQSIAVRISIPTMWTDAPKGTRKLSYRSAEGWTTAGKIAPEGTVNVFKKVGPVVEARLRSALEILANADDDLVYILAFALEGSECGFCGLELDTQESLKVGYGPTCAKKHDLPWGEKAIPAKVALAKAGLVPAEAEVEAVVEVAAPVAEVPTSTVEEVIAALEAAVEAAQAELLTAEDDDAAFAKFVSAKKALKAAKAAAPAAPVAKADYDLQHDTDGAVVTPALVLRPITADDFADDDYYAAAADLANDAAAGN
jgi:Family of unknown function (DUF6011)